MTDFEKAVDIIRRDAEHQKKVMLNRIASDLESDYIDLMQVVDEPMTLELGECLRTEMIELFKILKKHGVDIESRI